jgi:hypothetical protein
MSSDPTEAARRARQSYLETNGTSREELQAQYGQVWDTAGLTKDFEVIGFLAPLVVVKRRSDGKKGSLEFVQTPRFYFNFRPHDE